MGSARGTRTRALAACLFIAATIAASGASAGVDAQTPAVRITSPADAHVYEPGETLSIEGTASATRGLKAIKLEYWLLNRLQRRVLAECTGCGTPAGTWTDAPTDLNPGYYVVKAYAVDDTGAFSDAQQRTFATGLQNLPRPTPPGTPDPPTSPPINVPGIKTPKPGGTLPGAEAPIPVGGTAPKNSEVTVFERNLGPIGTTVSNGSGRWKTSFRFPTGTYSLVAQATDTAGRVSPVSKLVSFRVDADRPQLSLPSGDVLVFPPTEPIQIEGSVFDNRRVASVWVEYWLLDQLALREQAQCPGCGVQESAWWSVPQGLMPGYYYVKVRAFDSAGNPSWVQTTSFIATL